MKKTVISVLLLLLALAGGAVLFVVGDAPPPGRGADGVSPRSLPALDGGERSLEHWHGQVRLVNLWATWCGPCREEIPLLVDLHRQYADQGFTVVGIALDDAEAVRDFAATLGMDYPLLVAGEAGIGLLAEFGNSKGVVPYSLLLDRDGRVAARWPGLLRRERVEAALMPLLER